MAVSPVLNLIFRTSMFVTLLTAILVGTTLPFIMDFLGFDIILALGPFITTIVDITEAFIWFQL